MYLKSSINIEFVEVTNIFFNKFGYIYMGVDEEIKDVSLLRPAGYYFVDKS